MSKFDILYYFLLSLRYKINKLNQHSQKWSVKM